MYDILNAKNAHKTASNMNILENSPTTSTSILKHATTVMTWCPVSSTTAVYAELARFPRNITVAASRFSLSPTLMLKHTVGLSS